MGVLIILQKHSKESDRKRENLMWLVIWTTDERNVRVRNVLDVDLKITLLKIFQSHQKRMINGESNYILMKKCNCACNNGENNSDQKIYASMERMSDNDKCPSGHFFVTVRN